MTASTKRDYNHSLRCRARTIFYSIFFQIFFSLQHHFNTIYTAHNYCNSLLPPCRAEKARASSTDSIPTLETADSQVFALGLWLSRSILVFGAGNEHYLNAHLEELDRRSVCLPQELTQVLGLCSQSGKQSTRYLPSTQTKLVHCICHSLYLLHHAMEYLVAPFHLSPQARIEADEMVPRAPTNTSSMLDFRTDLACSLSLSCISYLRQEVGPLHLIVDIHNTRKYTSTLIPGSGLDDYQQYAHLSQLHQHQSRLRTRSSF